MPGEALNGQPTLGGQWSALGLEGPGTQPSTFDESAGSPAHGDLLFFGGLDVTHRELDMVVGFRVSSATAFDLGAQVVPGSDLFIVVGDIAKVDRQGILLSYCLSARIERA